LLAIDNRYRRTPVTLPGNTPVTQAVIDTATLLGRADTDYQLHRVRCGAGT
jgi:hypothetical protein